MTCNGLENALAADMLKAAVTLSLLLPIVSHAQARPAPKRIQVAEGVYLFITQPYGNVGLDGNSVVLISNDGVLVFDSNGTPAAASAVLAEIRKLTNQPVRYVVNSHWHWDHWYGTETYQQAFPNLQIIAHEKTREMMMGPALEFNRPGVERDLPAYIASLEKQSPVPDGLPEARFFLEQKKNVHHAFPNITFTDRIDLFMGGREIQILHYDRAVTPGDTFLYLPQERVLITGDLLVNPISFALSCYPTEWLHTLEKIDNLEVETIVPGHGEPLHDKELLHATMDLFRALLKQGKEAKERGLAVDDARKSILPSLAPLKSRIIQDKPGLSEAFDVQLVDWYLHRVYDELDGPLTDAIAPIPRGL
jgi:glyoxylase-like metal-dependent hydrolase (beta-lactamase superfamily II)